MLGKDKAMLSVRKMQYYSEQEYLLSFSTPQAIYKWQNGTAMPTVENLVALATILGVTLAIIKPITGKAAPGSW